MMNSEEEMRVIIKENQLLYSQEEVLNFDGYGKEVYPTFKAPIINESKELQFINWGFEKWDNKGVIFNARSEGILSSKFFAPSLKNGRCIIPASAYFEWQRIGPKDLIKYRISSKIDTPLYIAGLLKLNSKGELTYTIITKDAANNIEFIHSRMPLILTKEQMNLWLDKNFDVNMINRQSIDVKYELVS
jgi:putative SOS response-associated peptidase YedK